MRERGRKIGRCEKERNHRPEEPFTPPTSRGRVKGTSTGCIPPPSLGMDHSTLFGICDDILVNPVSIVKCLIVWMNMLQSTCVSALWGHMAWWRCDARTQEGSLRSFNVPGSMSTCPLGLCVYVCVCVFVCHMIKGCVWVCGQAARHAPLCVYTPDSLRCLSQEVHTRTHTPNQNQNQTCITFVCTVWKTLIIDLCAERW